MEDFTGYFIASFVVAAILAGLNMLGLASISWVVIVTTPLWLLFAVAIVILGLIIAFVAFCFFLMCGAIPILICLSAIVVIVYATAYILTGGNLNW